MNNKGVALIFCLVVIAVLAVLSSSLFSRSISENSMAERYIYTEEALWTAEAGLTPCIDQLPTVTGPYPAGIATNIKANYSAFASSQVINDPFYQVDSTGTVTLPGAGQLTRRVRNIVRLDYPQSGDFDYALVTTGDLITRGQAHTIEGQPGFPSVLEHAELDFAALFGVEKEVVRANADHLYTEVTFGEPVDGITWVDVTPGNMLSIDGNLVGSGLLVVQGDTRIRGTVQFTGIIYVIGELWLSGTPVTSGSIFAESGADIDTTVEAGHVTITWSQEAIQSALDELDHLADKVVVAWYEI